MKTLLTTSLVLVALFLAGSAAAQAWEQVPIGDDPGNQPRILGMAIDGSTVWLSARTEGLWGYDGSGWVNHLQEDGGLSFDSWGYNMYVDSNGDKWVTRDWPLTADRLDDRGTLDAKNDDLWYAYTYAPGGSQFWNKRIFSMTETDAGDKWFGCRDEDHAHEVVVEHLIENDPSTIADDEWRHFDNALPPYETEFFDDDVRAVAIDHDGALWIGYHSVGLDVWQYGDLDDWDDDVWTHHDVSSGLPSNLVHTFHVAQDGKVWVGTLDGLAFYDPSDDAWTTVDDPRLPGSQMLAIDSDALGLVWVGTDEGVAALYPNGTVTATYTSDNDGLAGDVVDAIAVDRINGDIWALSLDVDEQTTALNVLRGGIAPAAGEVYGFPNPWRSDTYDKSLEIVGAPDGSKVEILDITGESVRVLETRQQPYVWDILDSSGSKAGSGVYVVRVEQPDGRTTFTKVAVIW